MLEWAHSKHWISAWEESELVSTPSLLFSWLQGGSPTTTTSANSTLPTPSSGASSTLLTPSSGASFVLLTTATRARSTLLQGVHFPECCSRVHGQFYQFYHAHATMCMTPGLALLPAIEGEG